MLLGGRLDQFDITVNDVKAGSAQSREDDEFSPRAGIIYKPQDNVSFYLSYSESFLPRSGEQYKNLLQVPRLLTQMFTKALKSVLTGTSLQILV